MGRQGGWRPDATEGVGWGLGEGCGAVVATTAEIRDLPLWAHLCVPEAIFALLLDLQPKSGAAEIFAGELGKWRASATFEIK